MSEDARLQQLRRVKQKTAKILDDESFCVGEARGKLANVFDFICFDKMGYKLTRICLDHITPSEFERVTTFRDARYDTGTIIQLFFWHPGETRPFYRPKLFYAQPKQDFPADLLRLVK